MGIETKIGADVQSLSPCIVFVLNSSKHHGNGLHAHIVLT